jgi:hypothetical protein
MREMGDFDPIGTPYHYMLAGWYASIFLARIIR